MTRAIEYVSLDVTERLHRPFPTGQRPPVVGRSSEEPLGRLAGDERGGERSISMED